MSQSSLLPPHRNQQLFADHYLDQILPLRSEWTQLQSEATTVFSTMKAIYDRYIPSDNEAQLERDVIRPMLDALGHSYEIQTALRTPDGTKQPDYVFYRNDTGRNALRNRTLNDDLLRSAGLAVGDAKAWDRSLDMAIRTERQRGDVFTNRNPSYQIAFYIQHSGLDWGILTNGRLWRLYHRDTAHKLDRFYEVDLPALLDAGDMGRFLYFYAFFRRAAFDDTGLSLITILHGSQEYARAVGDTIKQQVYDALEQLAQGFLDYPDNQLPLDAPTLKQIYNSSLIVLYRLLFVLYAEARDLLPLHESPQYRERYSFDAIARQVAHELDSGRVLLADSAEYWGRLRNLFRIIDRGSPPLKVATFNGGLFDPARHDFLERYSVGDARLQRAIDLLARVDQQFVDYRDLAERHLGTIYEGLLEHHLVPRPHLRPDGLRIELRNDKGERKATGSYYTPDYIVKYIVDQTVGPVLHRAIEGKADDAARIRAVFQTNVLDPAMGSGHFLVEATEYIARFLVDLNVQPTEDTGGEADVAYWRRRVVQSCIYGVDLNPLAVDLAKLSLWLATVAKNKPLSFLDHHLRCGNALVGAKIADLNVGSSGVGAQRKARKKAGSKAQLPMFSEQELAQTMTIAVDSMGLIENNPAATVDQVKEQERIYHDLRVGLMGKYGRLADLVTATYFGMEVDPTLWNTIADYATGRTQITLPKVPALLDHAARIAAERRFFHWELEFPEVFFDRQGQPLGDRAGFEAVIGNPPYVRQEELAPIKPYFSEKYTAVYHGVADLFVYFFAQAVALLEHGGRTSYISSNSWLRANYAGPLRAFLRTITTVEQLIDLGDNRVFADAPDVYPAIHVVRRETISSEHIAQVATFSRGEGLSNFAARTTSKFAPVTIHDQADSGWQLGDNAGRRLFTKLMVSGRPLGEIVNGQMYRGVLTGLNEAFIIDQATRDRLIAEDAASAEIIKPIVNGEDVRSWFVEDENRWLIFARRGINPSSYPAVIAHLRQFQNKLEPRPTNWDASNQWEGRKAGLYKWYEIQDTVDYYQQFEDYKIFWPELAKQPRFALAQPGVIGNKTTFMIPGEHPFLLGLLMTRVSWFTISKLCVPIGERKGMLRYTLSAQFISRLPIPDASTAALDTIGELAIAITDQARTRYDLHRRVRNRIVSDLGKSGKRLNQKLITWWTLDFPAFRAELQKVFQQDIPVRDRDDWDEWLADRRAIHEQRTAEIVRLETELNAQVYALFDLTSKEIQLIETSTKYKYGET